MSILMVGPTGSGKTEIARRLSQISEAPFIKVEATKFTEVGYHGSDVDQIIKDLVQTAVHACSRDLPSIEQEFKPLIEDLVTEQLLSLFCMQTRFLGVHSRTNRLKMNAVTG